MSARRRLRVTQTRIGMPITSAYQRPGPCAAFATELETSAEAPSVRAASSGVSATASDASPRPPHGHERGREEPEEEAVGERAGDDPPPASRSRPGHVEEGRPRTTCRCRSACARSTRRSSSGLELGPAGTPAGRTPGLGLRVVRRARVDGAQCSEAAVSVPGHAVRVEHDVHDRRLARGERALERGSELGRPARRVRHGRRRPRRAGRTASAPAASPPPRPGRTSRFAARGSLPRRRRSRRRSTTGSAEADERVEVEAVEAEGAVPHRQRRSARPTRRT